MSMTVDEALRFADQQYTPQSFAGVLTAEVRRLQAENAELLLSEEPLVCDNCGVECDDPWHYSREGHRHRHACDDCYAGLDAATVRDAEWLAWLLSDFGNRSAQVFREWDGESDLRAVIDAAADRLLEGE